MCSARALEVDPGPAPFPPPASLAAVLEQLRRGPIREAVLRHNIQLRIAKLQTKIWGEVPVIDIRFGLMGHELCDVTCTWQSWTQ